ncbi:MAG: carboxymuconolactone decarboxylase family protein [Planctomycetota bacterium]|nr:carboxymuconolactone decarboxylase family protein [Planctomycetota bacterium]
MPWIRTIGPDEATGRLGKTYAASIAQTGKVFGITSSMSLDPRVLDSSMGLYRDIVQEGDALSRRQREMLATVVSKANECHY